MRSERRSTRRSAQAGSATIHKLPVPATKLNRKSQAVVPKRPLKPAAPVDPAKVTGATATRFLDGHVARIRMLGKNIVTDIVEIGRLLTECKRRLPHGAWLPWLQREFGWTEQTALNYMRLYEAADKSKKFLDLDVPVSSLFLLTAPSTPEAAREEVIQRATGKPLRHREVKAIIAEHRAEERPFVAQQTADIPHSVPTPVEQPETEGPPVEVEEIIASGRASAMFLESELATHIANVLKALDAGETKLFDEKVIAKAIDNLQFLIEHGRRADRGELAPSDEIPAFLDRRSAP